MFLATLFGAMSFTACGETHETFKGKLSDESFDTENAALTAFLEDEIDGMSTQAELVEYVKDADLSQNEIATLPLGEIAPEKVSHAERGTISYRASTPQTRAMPASETDSLKTHAIYLFEVDERYRYFVPPTQIGQPITKDYFEDVLSSAKYANCTIEFLSSAKGTYNGSVQNTSASCIYKFTENALQITQKEETALGNYTLNSYIAERNGRYFYCTPNNISAYAAAVPDHSSGAWHIEKIDLGELDARFQTLGDLVRYFVTSGIDFSYFEKTKDGFGIMSAEKFLQIALDMIGGSVVTDVLQDFLKEFSYECVVQDGRLEKIESHMQAEGNFSMGEAQQEMKAEKKESYHFDQFGTTKVTLPEDLQQILEEL